MPSVIDMETLSVRFTVAQMKAIRLLAQRDRRKLAEIVRELAGQAIRQRGPEYRTLLDREEAKMADAR